jgi:hypothetical protein
MAGNAPRTDPQALLRLLLADRIDAAIDAGLMDYVPLPGDDTLDPAHPGLSRQLLAAQARLRTAWASRERHRARALRLARIAGERDARRIRPAPAAATVTALPAAAVAALARARAKAATRTDD